MFIKGVCDIVVIKKLKKTSLAEQVSNTIKEYIISKKWQPEFKIPSENDLAEKFGVNRLTVRMALQKLNTIGILETKAGDGTFVKSFNFSDYLNEISDLIISPEMLEDVLAFRKVLEINALRLAVQNASDAEIDLFNHITQEYEIASMEYIHGNLDKEALNKTIECDLELHYQICILSHNSVFPLVFNTIRGLLEQYLLSIYKRRRENNDIFIAGIKAHRDIVKYLKNRDFRSCKKAYLSVIDYSKIPNK